MSQPLDMLSIPRLKESIKMVHSCLNQACKTGTYSLDEAWLVKIACGNLDKAIYTLDEYQKLYTRSQQQAALSAETTPYPSALTSTSTTDPAPSATKVIDDA